MLLAPAEPGLPAQEAKPASAPIVRVMHQGVMADGLRQRRLPRLFVAAGQLAEPHALGMAQEEPALREREDKGPLGAHEGLSRVTAQLLAQDAQDTVPAALGQGLRRHR